jgi:hypothetical protein
VSRTGNLLFPDSEDDGWVTSIIKALPEEKPKDDAPVTDDIEDPVAIEAEAEAAFAETAASVPNDVVTAMRPGKTSPIKTLSKPSASRCPY